MKLSFGFFRTLAVDSDLRKKFIKACVGLIVFFALMIGMLIAAKSFFAEAKNPNMIDMDLIKPDGSLNEQEIFKNFIEERSRKANRYHKEIF